MKHYIISILLAVAAFATATAQQTNSKNYIISQNFKQAGANSNDVSKVVTQIQYLDGLGRPQQTVLVGQSTEGTDIVESTFYDADGRQTSQYLPFISTGNGSYKPNAAAGASTWYTSNSAGLKNNDLGRPYQQQLYEPSPLDRPIGEIAPGGNSNGSSIEYNANISGEVKRYDFSHSAGYASENGHYSPGTLSCIKTIDEQSNESRKFIDNTGKHICTVVTVSPTEKLYTYYIYDDFERLRAVLQPKFQDTGSLKNTAFLYDYDVKGRLIKKQIPGAGAVEYVYDSFDRQAMSRDSNQLQRNVWGFTKFDVFNRPIITGEISSSDSQVNWATAVSTGTQHHETRDNGAVSGYSLDKTAPTNAQIGNLLTITFYDDYSFQKSSALGYSAPAGYSSSPISDAKGQITGGRARILPITGTTLGQWLTNVVYYDNEYRTIQTVRELFDLGSNAIERVSTKYVYDLAPVVAEQKTEQILSSSINNIYTTTYSYDHADRLLTVKDKIETGSKIKEVYTLAQRYNTLGQIQSKWLHSYNGTDYRRRTDITNNIRGWLTDNVTVFKYTPGAPDTPFHHFHLGYSNPDNSAKYTNGNISTLEWADKDLPSMVGLSFTYDDANRLRNSAGINNYSNLETGITYDKNGNLLTLKRSGKSTDDLEYTYAGNGNQLATIDDKSGNLTGVKNGVSSYSYDVNGNMTQDGNRGASITYNYLNLPKSVSIGSKTFNYSYDSDGNKHKYETDVFTAKYAGTAEYNQTNSLTRVTTSVGQAVPSGDTIRFDYFLRDHLGNVRMVFDEKGTITQKTDYYPFGLSIIADGNLETSRNTINRNLYNSKELQVGSNFLDYGARFYMPELGKMTTIDRAAELFGHTSPYSYALNNPLVYVDPSGDTTVHINDFPTTPFDPKVDVVQFDQVTIKSSTNADYTMPQPGTQVMLPISGFWNEVDYFLNGRPSYDSRIVDRNGILTNLYSPITGTSPGAGLTRINPKDLLKLGRVLKSMVRKGNVPSQVKRVDVPKLDPNGQPVFGQQTHIHLQDGRALNLDGTWKHGDGSIPKSIIKWLDDVVKNL